MALITAARRTARILLTTALAVFAPFFVASRALSAQTAAPGSLQSVLAAARARLKATDERGSGRLVQVSASGARVSTNIAVKARWFPTGLRMLVVVPEARYLLTMQPNGRAAIEVLHKGAATSARLPLVRWGQGVAGTGFSPEDFVSGQFLWSRQKLLPAQNYGTRACWVLRSEPGPGQLSQYASVTTWIDRKTGAIVHVAAAPKSGPAKQFIFYGLERNAGVWIARQIEANLSGRPGSSLLILDHGSGRAQLDRKDLTLHSRSSTPSR